MSSDVHDEPGRPKPRSRIDLGVDELVLHEPVLVDARPPLGVAELHRCLAGRLGGLDGGDELVGGGRRLQAELVELGLVVEQPDDLAHLRQSVQLTLAEDGAVVAVRRQGADRLREAVEPAVRLGVLVERDEQARCDVLAHLRTAVVGLHHVRGVVARQCQAQRGSQVVGGARHAIDGDVGIGLREGGVERLDLFVLTAANLLVPDREGDLAELGGIGHASPVAAAVVSGAATSSPAGAQPTRSARAVTAATVGAHLRCAALMSFPFLVSPATQAARGRDLRWRFGRSPWSMGWIMIADIVQRPERKPRVAIALETWGTSSSGRIVSRNA